MGILLLKRIEMCMKNVVAICVCLLLVATQLWASPTANIPLDSPVYLYLEKLAGFGLITSEFKGIKPFSKSEAVRLLLEAEHNAAHDESASIFILELIAKIRETLKREFTMREDAGYQAKLIDWEPVSSLRFRSVWRDGVARNYQRLVHDPGNDGVFGIGSGLRPVTPNFVVTQRGGEGTPLVENNNGVVYDDGFNGELRISQEWYIGNWGAGLVEPDVKVSSDTRINLNRSYLKFGDGALELEVGKDENWFGVGYRGNITLTNNAENFTQLKLDSAEPLNVKYIGPMKYAVIISKFDRTIVDGLYERQPWYFAAKLSVKPLSNFEVGFNLGRQVGGTGVDNSFNDTLHGLIGGTDHDNSNSIAGFEVRYRMPWLRNTEIYGEFSGEDAAAFWPIVESYVAGIYIPLLTIDGRNDFRFEFFQGNQVLYTNETFKEGYIYKNMPIGHSQGGATRDFFMRYSHWFNVRNNVALECIFTDRGYVGRLVGQALEKKYAGRIFWRMPLSEKIEGEVSYGVEKIDNFNLVQNNDQTNQLAKFEIRYNY